MEIIVAGVKFFNPSPAPSTSAPEVRDNGNNTKQTSLTADPGLAKTELFTAPTSSNTVGQNNVGVDIFFSNPA